MPIIEMSQKALKIRENYHLYEIFFVSLQRETIKQGTMAEEKKVKYGFGLATDQTQCFCDEFDSVEELIEFAKDAWETEDSTYFNEDDEYCIIIGVIEHHAPSDFAPSLDWVADSMTDSFYSEHNIDDDADVQICNRKEVEEEWEKFVNKYFDIPHTFTCDWSVGVYNLKENKWVTED